MHSGPEAHPEARSEVDPLIYPCSYTFSLWNDPTLAGNCTPASNSLAETDTQLLEQRRNISTSAWRTCRCGDSEGLNTLLSVNLDDPDQDVN